MRRHRPPELRPEWAPGPDAPKRLWGSAPHEEAVQAAQRLRGQLPGRRPEGLDKGGGDDDEQT